MALMSREGETGAASGPADLRYQAFLSYSHADSDAADWLHKAIERFAVPGTLVGRMTPAGVVPKSLRPIFRDRHELAASSDLGQTIRQAIKASRHLIVLCSPAAAASRWVNEEIVAFKKLHGEKRVLAAIVAGEPWTSEIDGREGEECFPPTLREKYDRRGHPTGKRAEPIAADLRAGRDGREAGKLKLIAGMLGLGLDDLVRREQQRRQKRLTYIAAASIAGMAVTSGLAVFAFDKRDEARDQRREAEGLVGFMLGDLREELEPIGKLKALDAVGTRALAYFEKQDKGELSDAALAQRSRALNLLGQIAQTRGQAKGALAGYREAIRSSGELVERAPNDPQRLFDHAQNIFYLGDFERDRGNAAQAEAAYRMYKALADRMILADPTNPKFRMEALYANENLGIALYNQRRFDEAATKIASSLRPLRSGGEVVMRGSEYHRELSTLLAWLADANGSLGRLAAATKIRREQISLLQRLLATGNSDVSFREHLITAHRALGILLGIQGEHRAGFDELSKAVSIGRELVMVEPENSKWGGLLAQAQLQIASALVDDDRAAEAIGHASIGCNQAKRVLERDLTPNWRVLRTTCLTVMARLASFGDDRPRALQLAKQALQAAKAQRSADSIRDRYQIASAYRLIGDMEREAGSISQAKQAWQTGLDHVVNNAVEQPRETYERVELLRRLGRPREAAPLIARLKAMGFETSS